MKIRPEDRRILDALLAEINNPSTTDERRAELRDEHSSIAEGYIIEEMYEGEGTAWEIMAKLAISAVPVEVVSEMFGDTIIPGAAGFSYQRKNSRAPQEIEDSPPDQ